MKTKKVIFITGAGSGLGKVIAKTLSQEGHTVYGSYYSSKISKKNKNLFKLDIRSSGDVRAVLQKILRQEKGIDVIINNAGATISGSVQHNSVDDFHRILEMNVLGPFRVIKEVLTRSKKPQTIINITSMSAFVSLPNFAIYSSSKHAMEAFGIALRYELWPEIKVTNVTPGALVSKNNAKISHKTARAKFPVLNWLIPLTSYDKVARSVAHLVDRTNPPKRLIIGRDAKCINILQRLLPDYVFDRLMLYIWRKK